MDETTSQTPVENRVEASRENQPNQTNEAPPEWTKYQPIREAIERELEQLDRSSFRRILADYLGYAPTPKAIARLAEKQPDRWIQGLTMLAQLAGFKRDTVEINNNILVVQQMSDSELRKRLADAQQAQLELSQSKTLVHQDDVSRETNRMENLQIRPTSFEPVSRDPNIIDVDAKRTDDLTSNHVHADDMHADDSKPNDPGSDA